MPQNPAIFLSALCLMLGSRTTSSVPLDVQTKDNPQSSSPFIILPQSAQSESDIYDVEDNAEHGQYL